MKKPEKLNSILLILILMLVPGMVNSHPWGGLVIDSEGNIYFTFICPIADNDHYACVWKIDPEQKLSEVLKSQRSPSDIVLSRDIFRNVFGAERTGNAPNYTNSFWKVGANNEGTIILQTRDQNIFHIQAYAVHENGDLYFAKDNSLFIRDKEGSVSELDISTPENQRIGLMEFSSSGELYILAGDNLYSFDGNKTSLIAADLKEENPDNIPFRGANILFDMAIDENGSIYLAYYGNRSVIKVTPNGAKSTILEAEGPWSPHGVDIFNGELYVLESTLGDGKWWKFWQDERIIPRVRKLGSDGTVSTLYKYETD